MTIAEVRAYPLSYRYPTPPGRLAMGVAFKMDSVIVKVIDDSGAVGWGESHHGYSHTAVAEHVNVTLAPLVVAEDPFDVEGIWNKLYRRVVRTHGLSGGAISSMSGLDMALWDIRGKITGLPVYRLLGGGQREFEAYSGSLTLGFQEPSALEDEVHRLVAEGGYRAVKLRIGDSPEKDAERVERIRSVFGPGFKIMVDANTAYEFLDLPRLLPTLEETKVTWLEEPYAPDDIHSLAELRRRTSVPLAVGENLHGRRDLAPVLEARAIDVVQADPSKCGGITELKKIGDLAGMHHLRFAPHSSHTALNRAAVLHVMSATPSAYIYEAGMLESPFANGVFSAPIVPKDGAVRAPDLPGLGVEVDEERFGQFAAIPGPQHR